MKAKVKLYKNDGKGDLGFPIKLIISHQRKTRRKTISYSQEEDWDPVQEIPKVTHDDFEDLYGRIMDLRKKSAKMEFREILDFEAAFEYLLEKKNRSKLTADFFVWGDRCVAQMVSEDRIGNAKSYQNSLDALQRYSPRLKFSELTPHFLDDFKSFCKGRGNENKTIKHYGIALRAIYNRAVKKKLVENTEPFKGFFEDIPTQDMRKKNRYLGLESIRKLEAADLPEGQRRSVDLALLQFYLGGADLVDIYYLKKAQLTAKRVFLKRTKLGKKGYEFDVLLPKKGKVIIEKYRDPLQEDYLFPWRKDRLGYDTFSNNLRRDLEKVQKQLKIKLKPKDEKLTSKVMRHSFATLGKFHYFHEDLLRELMGHERRKDIDTTYKDIFPEKERDAAQLKIIGENSFLGKTKTTRKVQVVRKIKKKNR